MPCQIVHELPGRLRIHLSIPSRQNIDRQQVEDWFEGLAGVKKAAFGPRTRNLLIHYEGGFASRKALLKRAESFSFQGGIQVKPAAELERKQKALMNSGALLLAGPLLPPAVRPVVTLFGAFPIFKKGAISLGQKRVNADVLDTTAILVSVASGEFLAASIITFLLKLGEYLEEWTRRRFRKHLAAMFRTGDEWAWVRRDGREVRVNSKEIREGDAVIVRLGSHIPVDGVILEGEALVNQASLTGESLPVMKRKGKLVYAGTAVEEGSLEVRALKVGSETRAARVVKVIEEAEGLKAEAQSYGERLADRLVPYSFLLSGFTYALTGNSRRAAAVLMVDYSCAIKLSTPLAILVGLARAARENVLIKGGRYLEKLSQADFFIFDKTGTLTEAAPKVVEVLPFEDYNGEYVLEQAACVEEHFPHPVATAIVKSAAKRGLTHHGEEHEEVEYVVAHGIVSRVHGHRIMVGSRHFIHEDERVDISTAEPFVESFAERGCSVLYVAIGGKLAGLIAIHDPLKTEARSFIDRLRAEGIEKVVMLTGDNEPTARTVARQLDVDQFYAQAFPDMKVRIVQGLQQQGHVIAMVGDGINDSPALSYADVGISLKHGADIAREACDVLLMEGALGDILKARRIARETLDSISWNYGAIIAVNSLAMFLGMTGIIPPVFSAAMHNLATIGVSLLALQPLRFDATNFLSSGISRRPVSAPIN
ncbi:MAG: heavy metal translocating P-type ATPase [Deltaproteobacteria bacterium]|nr:heavy metal translocating P-type ATPase [Deltaproteobacteria bacterium]